MRCLIFALLVLAGTKESVADAAGSPFAPAISPGPLCSRVDPFIGTGGISYVSGCVSPAANLPFGMVRVGPDTVSLIGRKATNSSGYYYRDDRIMGFSHTRLSGTGAIDGGHFLVMPSTRPFAPQLRASGLNTPYAHNREAAFPGYYAVELPELGVVAELTATPRVGVHRYTFPANTAPHVLIQVSSVLGKGRCEDASVRILPNANEVEGSANTFGTFSGRYGGIKVYFAARFNRAAGSYAVWTGDALNKGGLDANGKDIGADIGFPASKSQSTVELRLAISYVSIANARANLDAETIGKSFNQIFSEASAAWEKCLSRIRVEGGSEREQKIFYTALYHSFLMPTTFNDINGEYIGFDKKTHRAQGFTYYTDMSLWDTFRTTHPLYNLIAPVEQRDMMRSLVEMVRQGGYLPRWPSGHGYTNSMFGTPADVVVAEAYLKGIRDFDVETAYQTMRKTALAPPGKESRFSGRSGVEEYVKFQYCPAERMEQAVSRTIEFSYSDSAVSRLAEALGKTDDAKLFAEHSRYYRNLWNPETQYLQPRNSDGTFVKAFQPLLLTYFDRTGEFTNDYVEGSALQWRWAPSHDADGLVALFKSREYFVSELNEFFEKSTPEVGALPNAYYWHGNQPDLAAAYLFNSAGRPDLTQKWVRWILDHKYGDKDNGIDGNDDGGTLSAWCVLSSLGFYPVAGSDRYEIGTPIWKRAEIDTGKVPLTVTAENVSPEKLYIQRTLLNDKPLDRSWLKHAELSGGARLHFEMGATPPASK